MRKAQKLAAGIAAIMMVSAISAPVSFAADNTFGIDEINWTDEDWNSIAMTNDDTVDTGAVIRTKADADSKAAGYLYRGAAVQVVDKGEEWTEVRSGRVNGFVKNEFLAYGDDARGLAAHYGKQGIVANWNDVNVFSEDHADAPVAAQVSDGTPMSMIQDNGHWITVQNGADSAGFVSEDDVTRVLLVDTAVPAEGEDDEDVPATMTAADYTVMAASSREEDTDSASQETFGSVQAAVESYEGTSDDSYTEPAAYTDDSAYTDDASYSAEDAYSDYTAYTQDASSADSTASYDGNDTSETQTTDAGTLSTQSVSDNADIQALYDAYIQAQNAAMDCTTAEDAQTKADAAIAAWNAYLEACGETPVTTSAQTAEQTTSQAEETSYTDTDTYSESTDTTVDETAETVQTEAAAQTEQQTQASSSGSSAYGSYSDLDLLAAIIWCEAGNQPYDGMVAVGQVVMNRVASASYPNTISEVLNQPGQFTPASAGTLQAALAAGVNSNCYAAAQDAMNGATPVPGYPMYFNTHSGSYQLGAHYFS